MRYMFFIIFATCFFHANAQILATTSTGKKVFLYQDGTWKYADGGQEEKPCAKNHTGEITVKNATGSDIYFYYATDEYGKKEFVKVKANAKKTISDLYVGSYDWQGKLNNAYNYKWKATAELDQSGGTLLTYVRGEIETGSFMVNECDVKEISIGE